jgi:DNA-binding CsgD family transcriptional regulator
MQNLTMPAILKTFFKSHALLFRISLITAAVVIGFQLIGQLVIYRYLKLDYYLSLVAVAFLAAGVLLKRPSRSEHRLDQPVPPVTPDLLTILTSKEFLILRLLAEGKTNKEIAVAHCVEVSTIKTHVNNIYTKLCVSNRAQARARYAEIAEKLPIS